MALTFTCFDEFQPKLGRRCNMGTCICWWGQRSHIKIKDYLRSSCKKLKKWKWSHLKSWMSDWNQTWVYWYNMGSLNVHAVIYLNQRSLEVKLYDWSKMKNSLYLKSWSLIGTKLSLMICIIHKPRRQATPAIHKYVSF